MTEISPAQLQSMQEQMKKQQETIDLLMKALPQDQLARLGKDPKKHGKTIRVWTYRPSITEDPRLIVRTELKSNDVSFNPMNGAIIEDQRIELFFSTDKDDYKRINATKAQIGKLKNAENPDFDKIAEKEEELRKLELPKSVEMSYYNFAVKELGNRIQKVEVTVKGTKEINGKHYFIFDWNGEETELSIDFVN